MPKQFLISVLLEFRLYENENKTIKTKTTTVSILRHSPYLQNFAHLYIHKVYAPKKKNKGETQKSLFGFLFYCIVRSCGEGLSCVFSVSLND